MVVLNKKANRLAASSPLLYYNRCYDTTHRAFRRSSSLLSSENNVGRCFARHLRGHLHSVCHALHLKCGMSYLRTTVVVGTLSKHGKHLELKFLKVSVHLIFPSASVVSKATSLQFVLLLFGGSTGTRRLQDSLPTHTRASSQSARS